ncbi:amidohydrolase, partial [Vibrio sp. 10N.222.51.A6]
MNNKLTLPRTAWIALFASLVSVPSAFSQSLTADQIFTNADIYGHRESDSIVTHKGKIIFIGDHA